MASYYDEHNCQPLGEGEQPNHLLQMARLLIDGGYAREWDMDFANIFAGERSPPPASKEAVKSLPTLSITAAQAALVKKCPVCLAEFNIEEKVKQMPCKHTFHPQCLLPWLEKTNSCPLCRHELPTDDKDYEELKQQKAREKQREYELETLHNSMFG